MIDPYAASPATPTDTAPASACYQPRIFAMRGRLGRIRYIAYSSLAALLGMTWCAVLLLVLKFSGALPIDSTFVTNPVERLVDIFAVYLPMLFCGCILSLRRFNDLDQSSWLSLLALVPLVNGIVGLYLMCAPGTPGRNKYGPPPVPNTVTLVLLGVVVPVTISILIGVAAMSTGSQVVNAAAATLSAPASGD